MCTTNLGKPWMTRQETEELRQAARNPQSRYLSVKLSCRGDIYVVCIGMDRGRRALTCSGVVTAEQLEELIRLFDPDGSIEEKSDRGRNVNFTLQR